MHLCCSDSAKVPSWRHQINVALAINKYVAIVLLWTRRTGWHLYTSSCASLPPQGVIPVMALFLAAARRKPGRINDAAAINKYVTMSSSFSAAKMCPATDAKVVCTSALYQFSGHHYQ